MRAVRFCVGDYFICINDLLSRARVRGRGSARAFSIISIGNIIFHVLDNFARRSALRKPAHYVRGCYCYRPMLNNNEHVRCVSVRATLFNGLAGERADERLGGVSVRASELIVFYTLLIDTR